MFPITMTIHNPTQLNAVLAALSIEQPVPAPAAVVKEAKPEATAKKPDGAAQTAETKPTATTAAAESFQSVAAETGMTAAQATEALNGHADKPADAPTYQDAANAINALAKAKGRAAAVAVLASFDAAKLPDVKPEQFADVIAAAEQYEPAQEAQQPKTSNVVKGSQPVGNVREGRTSPKLSDSFNEE